MADVKRNISEVGLADSHDDKKQHQTKPGRKPIETVPKSKRTAQNRAAQRAYRERKEQRMKDLEDKVKSLENETIRATTESDFLKAQVDVLKSELARYRGTTDFSDLKLPTKVGHLSNPVGHKNSTTSSSGSLSGLSSSHTSPEEDPKNGISVSFPWSKNNLPTNKYSLPDLVGGSSSSTSPLDNTLVSPESSNSISSTSNPNTVNSLQYENLDFGIKFEEQSNPFCAQLTDGVCGTKECPVPKCKTETVQSTTTDSPFTSLADFKDPKHSENYMNDPFFNGDANDFTYPDVLTSNTIPSATNDPLSFLNDDNFDVSLAFGDNFKQPHLDSYDPISQLTTEESIYDPLKDQKNTVESFDFNEYVNTATSNSDKPTVNSLSPDIKSEDEDEVVPAPEETVRCSEIWDRITSHPKYTDIDIDSLCNELKSKAKCSEKGVVINSSDVNQLLERSAERKI
ncbi:AP-1-like transcription factor Cap1p [[Candida] anglica]|uniref:AP-1-like transcription factor Cap1p n=1 Tax=[Candida] anglica TaxID=148631 RepID=A0ABP0EMQ0_9ASCO